MAGKVYSSPASQTPRVPSADWHKFIVPPPLPLRHVTAFSNPSESPSGTLQVFGVPKTQDPAMHSGGVTAPASASSEKNTVSATAVVNT